MVTEAYIAIARPNAKSNVAAYERARHCRSSIVRQTDRPTSCGLLGETLDAANSAWSAFKDDSGHWQVAIHFRNAPDEVGLRDLVKLAAGKAAAEALSIERIPGADWVARSLAGLRPVRAGRFIVHGAHDRAGLRSQRHRHRDRSRPRLRHRSSRHNPWLPPCAGRPDETPAHFQCARYRHRQWRACNCRGADAAGGALLPAISTRWRCALPGTTPGRTTRYRWSPSHAPPVSALKQFARVDPTT